jgi:hypothetical protein
MTKLNGFYMDGRKLTLEIYRLSLKKLATTKLPVSAIIFFYNDVDVIMHVCSSCQQIIFVPSPSPTSFLMIPSGHLGLKQEISQLYMYIFMDGLMLMISPLTII